MMVKTEACIEVWLRCLRWMRGGGGLHEKESERESDTEHRFKLCKAEADWLKDGGREDVWTRVMMLECPMWWRDYKINSQPEISAHCAKLNRSILPVTLLQILISCRRLCEHSSSPVGQESSRPAYFQQPAQTLQDCQVHWTVIWHMWQQSAPVPWTEGTGKQPSHPLWKTAMESHQARGDTNISTPERRLSLWATPDRNIVYPLSRPQKNYNTITKNW